MVGRKIVSVKKKKWGGGGWRDVLSVQLLNQCLKPLLGLFLGYGSDSRDHSCLGTCGTYGDLQCSLLVAPPPLPVINDQSLRGDPVSSTDHGGSVRPAHQGLGSGRAGQGGPLVEAP